MNIPVGRNAGQKVRKGTKESSPEGSFARQ